MEKRLFLSVLLFMLVFTGVGFVSGLDVGPGAKIDTSLTERFVQEERVRVIVNIRDNGKIPSDLVAVTNVLEQINGAQVEEIIPEALVAHLSKKDVERIAHNINVFYIEPVREAYPLLHDAVEITSASDTWELDVSGVHLDGAGTTVCVIDSGVDLSHPDLDSKNALPGTTQLVCPDELFGTCIEEEAVDTIGHGTHVAGIVAAQGTINGIARGADIISLRVFSGPGDSATALEINNALKWCRDHVDEYNIVATSMSIGTTHVFENHCTSGFVENRVRQLADEFHISSVIASGNSNNSDGISWPACSDKAIPVGGTDKDDTLGTYSNYNELVRVFAPGSGIESTCTDDRYCLKTGTSMATPMVAGAIAILNQASELQRGDARILHPKDEIEPLLFNHGEVISGLNFNLWRRLNIFDVITDVIGSTCIADVTGDGSVGMGDVNFILAHWGQSGEGDIDGSGSVDYGDILILIAHWGNCEGNGEGITDDERANVKALVDVYARSEKLA